MRTIEISTDVYAKIWGHRLAGEETEDVILRRLLAVSPPQADSLRGSTYMKRTLWRDDVRSALETLGGPAPLAAIYDVVRDIRRASNRKIPVSLEAIVRRELEYNSSDSDSFTKKYDWFWSVEGIGRGIWALRPQG